MPSHVSKKVLRQVMFGAAILIWGCLIVFGARAVLRYENGSATPGESPSQWPSGAGIRRPGDKFVLVMTAHPDCPCTRASVAQLEQLMAQLNGNLAAFILFSKPAASAEEVRTSELWRKAAMIPGVSVLYDAQAAESARFGGRVSGQSMLYDRDGRRVFMGGLTSGRGREGSSAGAEAIVHRVSGTAQAPASTPVFGCSLSDPGAKELKEDSSWKKR